MSYATLIGALNGLVASPTWGTTVGLPTYPADYKGAISSVPYLRYTVVTGKTDRSAYQDNKVVKGLVMVSIFYKSGEAQLSTATIADNLNTVFQDKLVSDNLQLKEGSLQYLGTDDFDNSLSKADYSVPFTYHYGD